MLQKVCLLQNPEVFVQFRPGKNTTSTKSSCDFVVFGTYAAKDVPVGVPIERFYTLSFSEIYKLTEKTLPWVEQEFYPELVSENSEGYLSIQENKLVYLLLEEVKLLRDEVNKLKKEV